MTSSWKAVLGVILIFIFGFISGVVGSSIYVHHRMVDFLQQPGVAASAALERRMTRNLDLDANQKEQVHDYFLENLRQRRQLQMQLQPQIQALNQQTFVEIETMLRPDQQEWFHKNVEQFRRHFAKNALNPNMGNEAASPAQPPGPAATNAAPAPPSGK